MHKSVTGMVVIALVAVLGFSACTSAPTPAPQKIPVVATTSILTDVVSRVGGDLVSITTLVPTGSSEHEYQPSPRDIAAVSDAALVFEIGLGLEEFMGTIILNAGTQVTPVSVSDGVVTREFTGVQDKHFSADPHVWLDPANVIVWVQNIESALSAYDPTHSDVYSANSATYIEELQSLDQWIVEETSLIPPGNRLIVTDHMLFGYFAEKYGFTVVGAIIPSYSSAAEASAQDLAALEDAITQYGVKAILVGDTVNPALAERVAEDTGTELVQFYTGSLSSPDGPAATYLDYMRYNVTTIVNALSD